MSSRLPATTREPRPHPCQKGEKDQARRPKSVGGELGRGQRDESPARRRSRVEAQRRGQREKGGKGEIIIIEESEEEEEEEKEKEEQEERKRGEGRRGFSRKVALGGEDGGKEDPEGTLRRDRYGSQCVSSQEADKAGPESPQAQQGFFELRDVDYLNEFHGHGGGHLAFRQEQGSSHRELGAWSAGGPERDADAPVLDPGGQHWLGGGWQDFASHPGTVQSDVHVQPPYRRGSQGVYNPGLGRRPTSPSPGSGSAGCGVPAHEVDRDDFKWHCVEHVAKAGASATGGSYDVLQARSSDSKKGSAPGPGHQRWDELRREGPPERERERWQRKREGKRQSQRGRRKEKLLSGGVVPEVEGYKAPRGVEEEEKKVEESLRSEKMRVRQGKNRRKRREKGRLKMGVGGSRKKVGRIDLDFRRIRKFARKLLPGQGLLRGATGLRGKFGLAEDFSMGEGALPHVQFSEPGLAATKSGKFQGTAGLDEPEKSEDLGLGQVEHGKEWESVGPAAEGSLENIVGWLNGKLDVFLERLCKTSTMGRLFPLPASTCLLGQLFPKNSPAERMFLRVLVWSLNSLNGEGTDAGEVASDYQRTVLAGLMSECERVSRWTLGGKAPSWPEFFKVKGVDYKGEEVLTAQTMTWSNVAPALPPEVGSVPLEDVVESGSRHYVLHFQEYVLEPEDQIIPKAPKVMVPPENWEEFCSQLISRGVFSRIHEDDIYKVGGQPLLNGLFGVSKNEFEGTTEIMRIIMNLIPLNGVVRGFDGDISTLPSWAGMAPLHLQPHEDLLVSSEDVRAFFYIFRVPSSWHPFLAFNRPLPERLCGERSGRWYPCSSVLPMGFKNSVSLAQHVHRYVLKKALGQVGLQGSEAELRKDRPFTVSNPMHRVYLDNFDELERASKVVAAVIEGKPSQLIHGLQEVYASMGIPRHPKKAVARSRMAEVQGAMVDGHLGVAYPKVEKVLRYAHLAKLLLEAGKASMKQMQIIGGGFVYMAMFRRPLLGSLNHIWQFIVECNGFPPVVQFPLPPEVKKELARFIGMIPLAYMDFRTEVSQVVTASDASESGGGVTASEGVTPLGAIASSCQVRGDVVEPSEITSVLTVGLFDGIGALRSAADALGWNVAGHIGVEKSAEARRVVESHFPGTIHVPDVQSVDREMVKQWAQQFTQVAVVLLGAGPPCQGVSGLNASRKGALRDERSCLFSHVGRIRGLIKECFPWAQVQALMENVASMDKTDQDVMSLSFGAEPWYIDAAGVSLAHRPRLYWVDWEITGSPEAVLDATPTQRASVTLKAPVESSRFLEPGWEK